MKTKDNIFLKGQYYKRFHLHWLGIAFTYNGVDDSVFHVRGHFAYTNSAHLDVQDMKKLEYENYGSKWEAIY